MKNATSERYQELQENWTTTQWNILDLSLIIDCTGSMSDWIENSKATLTRVIDQTVEGNSDMAVRVAFIGYRDLVDGDNIFNVKDLTFDIPAVKAFISGQRATGGGDLPEDAVGAGALHQATAGLTWHPASLRLAALVTDAPSHAVSPAGLEVAEVAAAMREERIDLMLFQLNNSTEDMYNEIHKTNGDDWVGFVDLREKIEESREEGYSLTSDVFQSSYASISGINFQNRLVGQINLKDSYFSG